MAALDLPSRPEPQPDEDIAAEAFDKARPSRAPWPGLKAV